MFTKSISNPNLLKVLDESNLKTSYGCNQEWYTTEWQRVSGCGPSVVSNIIIYLTRLASRLGASCISKANCLSLMEEIWEYVTPTKEDGISTTKMLYEDALTYTKAKGINVKYAFCDVPKDKSSRPTLPEVLFFLKGALLKDTPIAFVNLCNGDEKNLDPWHWVTIISLEYNEAGHSAFVIIMDEGLMKKIDLSLWYNTTTLGGGFVYFTISLLAIDKD